MIVSLVWALLASVAPPQSYTPAPTPAPRTFGTPARSNTLDAPTADTTRSNRRQTREERAYPLAVGEEINGVFERSDPTYGFGMWREDCYRIDVPPGEGLKIKIDVDGYRVRTSTHANCSFDSYRTSLETNEGSGAPYEHYFVAPEGPQFILIGAFIRSDRPYKVSLEAVSAAEWAQWQERVQLARIQDQQRRQQNSGGLFGALVRGAAMGVSGIDAPLMNADGSAPNTLEVLNTANAELARQNETLAARSDAIIASGTNGSQPVQGVTRSTVPSSAGASSTSPVEATQAGPASPPVSRYGWCYALSSGGDQRITYVSRIGRTERLLANGAMLGGSSSDWHTTVAREWSQQINAPHTNATCTARDRADDFEALRRTYTSGQQVVEIPWAPR